MKLSTRLLVLLLPTMTIVMVAYLYWSMAEREDTLVSQAEQEMGAYGAALAVALRYAFHSNTHAARGGDRADTVAGATSRRGADAAFRRRGPGAGARRAGAPHRAGRPRHRDDAGERAGDAGARDQHHGREPGNGPGAHH